MTASLLTVTSSTIDSRTVNTRETLAAFLRARRRELGLVFCEVIRYEFDPNTYNEESEGTHVFQTKLGKIFRVNGHESAILDIRLIAAEE